MAEVSLKSLWVFSTDADEASLILAALGGRLKPEDVSAARELGDRLTLQRRASANALAAAMSVHANKVKQT